MEQIDQIRINFSEDQLGLLNACLAFLLFGVALDLRWTHFHELLQAPRKALIGWASQWIVLPSSTLLLIFLLRPPASIALGMLLVSVCPGGVVSNYAVHLSKGNTALSVLLTTVSTLAAVVLTPLLFTGLAPLIPGADALISSIEVPFSKTILTILQLIVLPLILGMSMRHYLPKLTDVIHKPVGILSMVIFLGFVVVAIAANMENISAYLFMVFGWVLIHNLLALSGGYGLATLCGLNQADRRAITLETGIQNSGLALILIFNFFDGLGGMALMAAWWGIWHLIAAFGLAGTWRLILPQK